eukprot:357159-Amphidinium_carterae.1
MGMAEEEEIGQATSESCCDLYTKHVRRGRIGATWTACLKHIGHCFDFACAGMHEKESVNATYPPL